MDPEAFLAIGLAFFIVAVSPGPANIANAVLAMERGKAASFRFSLGLTLGIAVWGLVAVTGLGAILQGSVLVLSALEIFGGLYLLWLAWVSARGAADPDPEPEPDPEPAPDAQADQIADRHLRQGLILNLSNPKTVIAWMAALSVGLDADASVLSLATGYCVCVAVALAVNLGYMLVFSLDGVMAAYRRMRRGVMLAVAGLFAFAGLGLLRSAFVR